MLIMEVKLKTSRKDFFKLKTGVVLFASPLSVKC